MKKYFILSVLLFFLIACQSTVKSKSWNHFYNSGGLVSYQYAMEHSEPYSNTQMLNDLYVKYRYETVSRRVEELNALQEKAKKARELSNNAESAVLAEMDEKKKKELELASASLAQEADGSERIAAAMKNKVDQFISESKKIDDRLANCLTEISKHEGEISELEGQLELARSSLANDIQNNALERVASTKSKIEVLSNKLDEKQLALKGLNKERDKINKTFQLDLLNYIGAEIDETKVIHYVRTFKVHTRPNISISAGLQAISYTFSEKPDSRGIGFVNSLVPVQFNFLLNDVMIVEWIYDYETMEFTRQITPQETWSAAFGLAVGSMESNGYPFGFCFIPWQFYRKEFSVGIGIQWMNNMKSFGAPENYSLVIPFSYNFTLKQ
jgi:hypothetical protein